jgi:hypothetical protein
MAIEDGAVLAACLVEHTLTLFRFGPGEHRADDVSDREFGIAPAGKPS